jgi:hypothetical protein
MKVYKKKGIKEMKKEGDICLIQMGMKKPGRQK